MSVPKPLYFLATFPDPHQATAPRGGYRRNVEMLHLLETDYTPNLVVASSRTFKLELPVNGEQTVIAHQRMPFRWIKVFRYLRKHCPPQIPLICYNPTLHTLPALWLRWLGRTIIVDYVDIQGTVVESTNPLLRQLGVLVERLFTRSCQYFITSSTAICERIHALNPAANVHLYRGTFQPPVYLETSDAAPDLPPDTVKILYLGMMRDFSGVRDLLRAFIDLGTPNAHLYIAGHGPAKPACIQFAEAYAPARISFPELDDATLHPFMQHMDILTVPYLDVPRNHINFPSKIIEYLWAGKAILGTRVGEIQHVLQNNKTALLVPPTASGLHHGLKRLVEDAGLRRTLGANARAEFERTYHPDVVQHALNTFIAQAEGGEV